MSFSGDIKTELAEQASPTRHCKLAELTAICGCCGEYIPRPGGGLFFMLQSESEYPIKAAYQLIKKLFHAAPEVLLSTGRSQARQRNYLLLLKDADTVGKMLFETKLMKAGGALVDLSLPHADLIPKNTCCKRAYLQGLFLCCGTMSDPHKAYRIEFVCESGADADDTAALLAEFGIKAKRTKRKNRDIIYIKEGEKIADTLGIIGARKALLEFENIRILKDISGNVNRQVNCEAANMNKTAVAGTQQIRYIEKIAAVRGLDSLPDDLRELAQARLANPDMGLKELGALLSPPVGKSGVYHRFNRIKEIAEEIEE